ncbi:MAG: Zn-ribbon domain-containing OB-fold protein [Dietzia sp.]
MTNTFAWDSLFAGIDPPVLAGSQCSTCSTVAFPVASRCPGCTGTEISRIGLPTRGTVWTWTEQRFAPKPPYQPPVGGFEAFVVGYVDLGPVLVESRITGRVEIGDEVELMLLDLDHGVTGFAFGRVER